MMGAMDPRIGFALSEFKHKLAEQRARLLAGCDPETRAALRAKWESEEQEAVAERRHQELLAAIRDCRSSR